MKKWLTKNWTAIVLVGVILFLLTDGVMKSNASKTKIEVKSDSIAKLEYEYQELEKSEALAAELASAYRFAFIAYQDSLQDYGIKYINQKKRHEKQVADLTRMPTDSVYVELKSWLDTIAF